MQDLYTALADDLWMIAQSPNLSAEDKATCMDAADMCANTKVQSQEMYQELDTLRCAMIAVALSHV